MVRLSLGLDAIPCHHRPCQEQAMMVCVMMANDGSCWARSDTLSKLADRVQAMPAQLASFATDTSERQ